ncbi:exodeoxyribonuclease VII large subunit [Oceanicella actignis]|uniref:Exodeoxyribonuclease 7 large subunit n=1 Tax=Oceanicella actignis TaxID=1189325 RepID=A0A1M7T579_9RHOB|nr:exodeoxyribonuclease VII large subunit [Oceanicella actignis]SET43032.1 Exodeoxyribonuclease VII large subunit [Oceanicella actignis]SHN65910.1 Exodeoxyribonuclease VII large subunit [Oceanicella actignis]
MSDLFEAPTARANLPELSVSELSAAVKKTIESGFGHVRVRGEVGRVSRPRSGHVYLDLKDESAVLATVIWRGVAARLSIQPQEGDEVVVTGRLTTFPGASRYQLVVEDMAYAGEGALLAKLERLKKALAAEGLFDAARKKPLPYLPEVIGVITSPSGAVIRDILHRLRDRFPRRVLLWPVAVQGQGCAEQVAHAIRGFNALPPDGPVPRPDVLIVARGGGSIEDLWGFNEEIVARAAAESRIPLISAVGHETDTTLIDFAADRRAPTPTAAAEMAVPVRAELLAALAGLEERRLRAMNRRLEESARRLRDLARALPRPEQLMAERAQRLDMLAARLPRALIAFAHAKRGEMARGAAARFGPALLAGAARERRRALQALDGRRAPAMRRLLRDAARRLDELSARARPERLSPRLARERRMLADLSRRLDRAADALTQRPRDRLDKAARLLESYSYKGTLARGFAVIRDEDGAPVTSAAALRAGMRVAIELHDGARPARIEGDAPQPRPAPRRAAAPDGGQGSLF